MFPCCICPDNLLGAPGAGKGTLSAHLAQKQNMLHYSLGDNLRSWMRDNRDTPLAAKIQDRMDNQGILTAEELSPYLNRAVVDAICNGNSGVIVDGFPRCVEQLQSFDAWITQDKLPALSGSTGRTETAARPDIVLLFDVTEDTARLRYLRRGRDSNDSKEKFEKRFREYQRETTLVEAKYEQRGILLRVGFFIWGRYSNADKSRLMQTVRSRRTSPRRWTNWKRAGYGKS